MDRAVTNKTTGEPPPFIWAANPSPKIFLPSIPLPPHNYRQWHIIEQALTAGWNNGSIKRGVVPAIPACPILWQDVSHYWNFGGILGIIAYELVAYIRVVIVIAGIILATHWNVLTPQKALTIILQQFGVILPS